MNLLLDTHAWLWFVLGDPKLSPRAKATILDPVNVKFLSPASYWEISIKISLGKYVLKIPYAQFMQHAIVGQGFRVLQILPAHTERLAALPFPLAEHRDPFDRLLVSQAIAEGMAIVTDDDKLRAYGVQVIW